MQDVVVWSLDNERYALPHAAVERVTRIVAITPLPDAPAIVLGIVNVQGRLVPVIDTRARFGLPPRDIQLSDRLIVARMRSRSAALLVDAVDGLARYAEQALVPVDAIVPGADCIAGVAKFSDGLILIHDLDRCLSLDDQAALEHSLDALKQGG